MQSILKVFRIGPAAALIFLSFLLSPMLAADDSAWVRINHSADELESLQGGLATGLKDYGAFQWGQVSASEIEALRAQGLRIVSFDNPFEMVLGGERYDPLHDDPAQFGFGSYEADPAGDWHIIQFQGPIRSEWLRDLRATGMAVVQPVYPFSYVVWATQTQMNAARSLSQVRWSGPKLPEHRVQPHNRDHDQAIRATMALVSRHDLRNAVTALIDAGAVVHNNTQLSNHFEVLHLDVAGDRYMTLAQIPGVYTVQYIPPEVAPRGEMSNQSIVGGIVGSSIVPGYLDWLNPTGVTGAGVIVGIVDGGIRTTHQDLAGNIVPCVPSGDSPTSCSTANNAHGTHVAAAVAGTGNSGVTDGLGFLRGQGVAPGASLIQQRYNSFIGAGPGGMVPEGMLKIFRESALSGALLTNNSWGPTGTPQGYDIPTMQIDFISRDALPNEPGHSPVLAVWSIMNGNGDSGGACAPSSLGSPDEAKNLFGVGSTGLQTTAGAQLPIAEVFGVSFNSGHGPACDGRRVPDIVAPGCRTDSAGAGSDTAHGLNCGTSMSAPVVAGAIALWAERYIAETGQNPSPALMKAVFIAAARDLVGGTDADGNPLGHRPDRKQGFGRVDLDAVMNPAGGEVFLMDQEEVFTETGQSWGLGLNAADPNEPMKIVLTWTDAPGHGGGGITPAWVNILDLEVVANDGNTYLGNVVGPDGWSEPGGLPDDRNNTEAVWLQPSQHQGGINLTVLATLIAGDALNPHNPGDPSQDFAIACYNCIIGDPTFTLALNPQEVGMCVPASGTEQSQVNINVGQLGAYSGTVALSTANEPTGVNSNLDPDSVEAPGTSVWTLTVDTSAGAGLSDISLTGDDGADVRSVDLALLLDEPLTEVPSLNQPADGATDVPLNPTFEWDGLTSVSGYRIQIATDAGFGDPVIDEMVEGTSFVVEDELATGTDFFWRVSGINLCGEGDWSTTFEFQTRFEPVADVSPDSFSFVVEVGNAASDTLSIGNIGTGNLVWAIETDALDGLPTQRDAYNPDLDEPVDLPQFSITGGGAVVEFPVDLGVLTRGDIIGFRFQGDVTGASGTAAWASDTCMVIEAPDGTSYGVGGFGTATIPGCGNENPWDFQGSGSANDGFYQSEHLNAFDPPLPDQGEWTIRFVMDFGTSTLTWDNVVVTFLKQPLPVCIEDLTDVPWLSVSPDSGSVPAGAIDQVTVSVDSDGLGHGVHVGYLCLTTNDAGSALIPIPVELEVINPGLGILEGNVTSLGICSEDGGPLAGATVMVEGVNNSFETTTDGNGNFSIMIEEAESPLDITVSAALHADATASGVVIEAGQVTVENFELSGDTACAEVSPDAIEETVDLGQTVEATIEIANTGTQPLNWALGFINGGGLMAVHDSAAEAGAEGAAGPPRPVPTREQEELGIEVDSGRSDHTPTASRITGAARRALIQEGVLLMPDSSGNRIVALDPNTGDIIDLNFIPEILGVGVPVQIILHPDGQRFLLTRQAGGAGGVIEEYDLDGNFSGIFAPIGGQNPELMQNIRGLAVHPDTGHILVAVAGVAATQFPNSVLAFDQSGEFVGPFIESGAGGLNGPWGIAFRDNDLLVSDSTGGSLRVFDLDGEFIEVFTTDPNFPQQIFENADGNILAAGFSNPSGAWEWDADGAQVGLYNPQTGLRGVYELPGGTILVANSPGIHEINRDNQLVRTITTDVIGRMLSFVQAEVAVECGDAQPPSWLSVDAGSGSTGPGNAATVTVTLDSAGLVPGQYSTEICVESNDPVAPVQTVEVTFNVELGNDFGVIEGDVMSQGFCGQDPFPAAGATIEFLGQTQTFTTVADAAGFYSIPLPVGDGPFEATASAPNHFPGTVTGIEVVGGGTVVVDFDLEAEAPCIEVAPTELSAVLPVGGSTTQTVSVANLGTGVLNWSIDDGSLRGESNPLIGFNFTTAASATADPQNWTRISTADGTLVNVPDDTGEATEVGIAWGGVTTAGFVFLGTSTLAGDAVPQYDYDLAGMTGYGFRSDGDFFIELSGLVPSAAYEYWFVAYRGASAIDNIVRVSEGDVINAIEFSQFLTAGDNNGRFVINDLVGSNSQDWNDLAFATTSSSAGEIRFNWQGGTQTTVIGALAVRAMVSCEVPDWLEVSPTSGQIAVGGAPEEVQVTFNADGLEPGQYVTNLCFDSDDPTRPVVPVMVSLEVGDDGFGELAVDPAELDFGQVPAGSQAVLSFTVSNAAGAGSIELSSLSIAGSAAFEISGGDCAVGTVLQAGESCDVAVRFAPDDVAAFSATAEVVTTDAQSESVELSGGGFIPPDEIFRDRFEMPDD